MPRTLWFPPFSHTQNAVSGITLSTERKTESKAKQGSQLKLGCVWLPGLHRWEGTLCLTIYILFFPICTEDSSLTLGAISVLLFSLSFAFDCKQRCCKAQYLNKAEPCPMLLMMESQALLWQRQAQSWEERRQALDPPHPSAACPHSSPPLPFSDMPTAAFPSCLVKCPGPLQGVHIQTLCLPGT